MTSILFTYDCIGDDCSGQATSGLEILDQDHTDEPIEIPIDYAISQITLRCDDCGRRYYTGDLDDIVEVSGP